MILFISSFVCYFALYFGRRNRVKNARRGCGLPGGYVRGLHVPGDFLLLFFTGLIRGAFKLSLRSWFGVPVSGRWRPYGVSGSLFLRGTGSWESVVLVDFLHIYAENLDYRAPLGVCKV
jgi:hypothetical protein